jgi:ceramide glucosyltransferase
VHLAISLLLAAIVAGSLVYCVLVVVAVRSYLRQPVPPLPATLPGISILKPLHGLDLGLEDNLRTFFTQDYPCYELLLATRDPADPALAVVAKLRREYPEIPARTILTGEPPYPNAKVWSLDHMTRAAANDLLVMSDSDIRVGPNLLRTIAAEFSDPRIGVATCPYRAVSGPSIWSRLEAVGMNTEFWAGVLVARLLEGVKFAVGPTTAARRSVLGDIGGWDRLKDYLAEDFVLGALAAEKGYGVILSRDIVEHRIGSQPMRQNFSHRLRWARSTRRSRPAGYVGQLFTNPFPIALLLLAVRPSWWPLFVAACVLRTAAAWFVARSVLGTRVGWLLVPVQDVLSFLFWLAGFFGNRIHWRGRTYRLLRDGTFEVEANHAP